MKKFLVVLLISLFCFIPVNAKEVKYKIVSGDIETVGSEICFDTECFYVIGNDGNNVKLLGKYNLYVGRKYSSRSYSDYGSEATGLQDPRMQGRVDSRYVGEGIVENFSSVYWSNTVTEFPAYIYGEKTNVYSYIEFYKSYLKSINVYVDKARVISYEELIELGCSDSSSSCADAPSWVYSTSYWVGSANAEKKVWIVSQNKDFIARVPSRTTNYGVRPVIEVPVKFFDDDGNVYHGSITKVDSDEGVISNDDNSVDLVLNDLEQYVKYQTIIYNSTNKEMFVHDINVKNLSEKFIDIKLDSKSENMIVESGGSSLITFYVRTLKEEGAGRNLNDNITIDFRLTDRNMNPGTFSNLFEVLTLIFILCCTIYFISKKKNKKINPLMLVVIFLLSITFVYADDFMVTSISGKVQYLSKNNIVSSGTVLNGKVADYTNSKEVWAYYDKVKNVEVKSIIDKPKKYFKEFDLTENKTGRVVAYLIENGDKDIPYDLVIMSNGVVIANSDSSFMFSFPNVEKVEGLSNVDFRGATTMQGMFIGNKKLSNIDKDSLEMNNTINTSYMFYDCDKITYTKSDFKLDNVTNSIMMFGDNLYNEIKKNSISDSNLTYYSDSSSGKYFINSTANDKYPIYFYRGVVDNNNVIFGNFCWKIVRTTDTGGIKLIYNGVSVDGKCESNSNNTIGKTVINTNNLSIMDAGYMYGDEYGISTMAMNGSTVNLYDKTDTPVSGSSYYYGKDFTYDGSKYTLVNPQLISWEASSKDMVGYYTCLNSTDFTCSELAYVFSSDKTKLYMSNVVGDNKNSAKNITLYKNAVSLSRNVFKLEEPVIIDKIDYTNNYANYVNYYLCNSSDINNCSSAKLIYKTSNLSYNIRNATVIYFANSYKYENGVYKLENYYKSNGNFIAEYDILANYRYTCGVYGTQCTYLDFITRNRDDGYIHLMSLSGGKSIDDALASVTQLKNSSSLKQMIDSWYEVNMIMYTDKLEDVVWYNEKDFTTGAFAGGLGNIPSFYAGYDRILSKKLPQYKYVNKNDMFTVSGEIGNGALTYPVGTITVDELAYAGLSFDSSYSSSFLKSNSVWWTMTPSDLSYNSPSYICVSSDNLLKTDRIQRSLDVRPMVSLKHGVLYSDGDGTVNNPYVIEVN